MTVFPQTIARDDYSFSCTKKGAIIWGGDYFNIAHRKLCPKNFIFSFKMITSCKLNRGTLSCLIWTIVFNVNNFRQQSSSSRSVSMDRTSPQHHPPHLPLWVPYLRGWGAIISRRVRGVGVIIQGRQLCTSKFEIIPTKGSNYSRGWLMEGHWAIIWGNMVTKLKATYLYFPSRLSANIAPKRGLK